MKGVNRVWKQIQKLRSRTRTRFAMVRETKIIFKPTRHVVLELNRTEQKQVRNVEREKLKSSFNQLAFRRDLILLYLSTTFVFALNPRSCARKMARRLSMLT